MVKAEVKLESPEDVFRKLHTIANSLVPINPENPLDPKRRKAVSLTYGNLRNYYNLVTSMLDFGETPPEDFNEFPVLAAMRQSQINQFLLFQEDFAKRGQEHILQEIQDLVYQEAVRKPPHST